MSLGNSLLDYNIILIPIPSVPRTLDPQFALRAYASNRPSSDGHQLHPLRYLQPRPAPPPPRPPRLLALHAGPSRTQHGQRLSSTVQLNGAAERCYQRQSSGQSFLGGGMAKGFLGQLKRFDAYRQVHSELTEGTPYGGVRPLPSPAHAVSPPTAANSPPTNAVF